MKISVIVACRNEAAHIGNFLESLLDQDMNGMEWEAIVADGMSDDGTSEILDEYIARCPRLRVIPNRQKIVSTGLNRAIRAACGEYILRMDAHTQYARDYCRRCVETLEQTGADNVGGPARTRAIGTQAQAVAAAYHSRFSTGGARFHDPTYEGQVDTVPYGCWRKSTIESLGLFDESLVRNQDDELNLRLLRAGGTIWQNPSIVSWYSPRTSLAALFQQYLQYGFWKVAVIRKHRVPGSWRHLIPALFVAANGLLPAASILSALAGAWQTMDASLVLWTAMLGSYAATVLAASVLTAHRTGWATLPYLPATFAAYHVSYGLGFVSGLFWFLAKSGLTEGQESTFTRVTR